MNRNSIIIGTRGSELARTQTGMVAETAAEVTGLPIETAIIKTEGDRVQDIPFHLMDGKGFFTKELEEALLDRRIDMAVHSLKDLPTQSPPGLVIAAIPPRAPANDLLLIREDVAGSQSPYGLPAEPVVGTSAKRRALQMKALHSGVRIKELRGNVPTRIRKLLNGEYDAILIAEAGFHRLGLSAEGYRAIKLDFNAMLPAPGQGALALQIRADDTWLLDTLKPLHDPATAAAVEAERAVLDLLGGGCGMPLGIHAERGDEGLKVKAMLGPDDWQLGDAPRCVRAESTGRTPQETAQRTIEALGVQAGR